MANSSPVVFENLIFVSTSNGQDESHVNVPSPKAPSIIAVEQDDRQAGVGRQPGRREDPARPVVVAGGRRRSATRCRSRSARATAGCAATRRKTGKKLWEFDLNPKDSVWPKTRNEVISTPVIHENVVYIANGQDPEHGEGVGHLYAIDADQARRHHAGAEGQGEEPKAADLALRQDPPLDLDRRASTTASSSTRTSAASCTRVDIKTGKPFWTHDMFAAIWGSPIVIDGKVYLGDEDGDVTIARRRQDDEGDRREQHGQLGLLDRRAGQRRAVHRQPQPAVRDRREVAQRPNGQACAATSVLSSGLLRLYRGSWRFIAAAHLVAALLLRICGPRQAPPDAWPQFRGSPRCSARRRDAAGHAQAAVDLRSGRRRSNRPRRSPTASSTSARSPANCTRSTWPTASCKWKYKASADGIGESSPAVAGGLVYIGDLGGVVHAVDAATGKAAWTFKTGGEVKSSPVVVGRPRADRLVRLAPLRARREGRQAARGRCRPRATSTPRRRSSTAWPTSPAATRSCAPSASATARKCSRSRRAPTPARRRRLSTAAPTTAPTRTKCWRVDLKAHKIVWRYKHPERNFPFYSSAAIAGGRVFVGGRDKMRARDRREDRQGGVDVHDPRARRLVAGRRRRPRLRRLRTTASSTCSTPRPARACSSSKPAARCPRPPRSPSGRLVIGSQDGKLFCLG